MEGRNYEDQTVNLVEIKPEPVIKWEQEDDVDTIEYTPTLNNSGENFAVKIEKVETADDDDDDVDQAWVLFENYDRFGNFDSLNYNGKPKSVPESMIETKSKHADCTSHAANHLKETGNVTTVRQEAACSHNYSERTEQVPEMHTEPAEENTEAPSTSKNINNRQSASLPKAKQHNCTECNYVTMRAYDLNIHMRKHTGEKPFPCKICSKRFAQNGNLQMHMKVHVTKDSVHCSNCFEIFATKEEKLNHESVCKRRRYECFLCQAFSSSYITDIKRHMRMHNGVRPFQCEQCFKKFTHNSHLKKHIKICSHSPKLQCLVCTRNFSKQSEKDVHEIKCKRRRYECHLCRIYSTYRKQSLELHMRMRHTGERPFKCYSCGKCYPGLSELNRHKKASDKHQLNGEK